MKHVLSTCLFTMLISTVAIQSLVIIQGDSSDFPYNFTVPISTHVLQKSTGTFFLGLFSGASDPTFSLAKAYRPNFVSPPQFIGIATDPNIQGADIEFLTVADQRETENQIIQQNKFSYKTVLPFVIAGILNFEATQVSAIFDNGSSFTQTGPLSDATGNTTGGIVQLATSMITTTTTRPIKNTSDMFAAVRPSTGDFGAINSGIALMSLSYTGTFISVDTLNASTGQSGNVAEFLDAYSDQLAGDSGGGPVEFSDDIDDINQVAFFYDDPFERLYIGVRIATGSAVGDIAKSVVVGHVDDSNALILEAISPDSAIDDALDQIVVVENDGSQPSLRANYVSVMHTSAGPSYLIVQGGNGTTDEVGNTIYALPLVDDPSDQSTHGTLANKNEPLTNFKFTLPAEAPDQLATQDDPAAFVGGDFLPIEPSDQISNMVIVGDAVFISLALEPTPVNDTGILYSQALFAADGKIIGWTPWTKHASPVDLFPQVTPSEGSAVQSFDVDATTGNIYIIPTTSDLVGITAWTEYVSTTTTLGTSLINALNDAVPEGCYCALDLPQSVRGFTDNVSEPLSRYALFGGVNKVVFTRISQAVDQATDAPQEVITDFSDPENFLITQLPAESGSVQVLEYSRQTFDEGATNYFFAGTDNGLFVFASANGQGFNVVDLSTLDQPPFQGGRWQKIPEIQGAVVDIKTSGLALYILTFETSVENPLKNTVYSVSFEPTLEEMFDPTFMNVRTLAQTKTEPVFNTTQLFTGMQIIATGDPDDVTITADKEQLILATNQGLYKSNANQGNNNEGSADAEDQDTAEWEIVPTTASTMYTGISGIETPIRHTTWPLSVQDNGCYSFDASSVEQLSGNGDTTQSDTGVVGFAPTFFNADVATHAFKTLQPITYFFSDGGRRFFIINPTAISSMETKLSVIPFDAHAWHVTSPQILKYPSLRHIQRFFWVETIGMSGLVLAGTNRGVIGLT